MAKQPVVKTYTKAELKETVNIEIVNGTGVTHHPVLRLLLVAHAPGFSKIFSNPNVQAVKLNNISPKTFDVCRGWLRMEYYRDKRKGKGMWKDWAGEPNWIKQGGGVDYYHDDCDPLMWEDVSATLWDHAEVIIDTFLFAEAYDILRLRQDAVDRLLWCHNTAYNRGEAGTFVSLEAIQRAYKHTQLGSGLRQVHTVGWCEFEDRDDLQDRVLLEALPKDFLIDFWLQYQLYGDGGYANIGGCEYHEHTDEGNVICDVRVSNIEDEE